MACPFLVSYLSVSQCRHMTTSTSVNIGSGNGLLPFGISWTIVILSSKVLCSIHLWATWDEVMINLIRNMCSDIIILKNNIIFPNGLFG